MSNCDDKLVYKQTFTVGAALPNISMTYHVPDPDGAGFSFELVVKKPDGECSIVPATLVESNENGGKYVFPWILATRSTVDLEVVLDPGVSLPIGTLVANAEGQQFRTTAVVENLGAAQATFPVTAEAVELGATPTTVNTLTVIVNPVNGWASVNNPTAGTDGLDPSLVEGCFQESFIRSTNATLEQQYIGPFFINVRGAPCP